MLVETQIEPHAEHVPVQGSPARGILRSRSGASLSTCTSPLGHVVRSESEPFGATAFRKQGCRDPSSWPSSPASVGGSTPTLRLLADSFSDARIPGDVARVVGLIGGGEPLTIQRDALKALARLTKENADVRAEMVSAGAIKHLVGYLVHNPIGPTEVPMFAAVTLGRLASQSDLHKRQVIEAGAVRKLLAFAGANAAPALQKEAFRALSLMCDDTACQRQVVKTPGGIDALVNGLRAGTAAVAGVEKFAAQVLAEIAANDAAQACAIGKIGPIPLLLALLRDGADFDVHERSAELLIVLARFEQNQRGIVKAGGVPRMMALLGTCEAASVRKRLVELLTLLASHKLNVPVFEKEGAVVSLERLIATDDDEDVRLGITKLLETLRSSKATQEACQPAAPNLG